MTEEHAPYGSPEQPAVEPPAEKPEEKAKELTLEEMFPLEDYRDTLILTLRQVVNNRLVQLEIFGNQKMMWLVKGNGPHEVMLTQGNPILIDGHDILWPLFVSREEHRQNAIARAKAELEARREAEAKAEKEAEEKAAKEKAEAAAKALEDAAPKRTGFLGWLRGR